MDTNAAWEAWLATRPPVVQALAHEFPPGSCWQLEGRAVYLVGWTEDDMLIVSTTDPAVHYEQAVASKEYLHAHHLRSDAYPDAWTTEGA